MAKKAISKAPSRPDKRGPPGPSPLLLIAGLPAVTAEPAAATINNDGKSRWRAIANSFTNRDGGIYEARSIFELGKAACRFAMEGGRDEDGVPTPSRIAVAYVEGDGFEQLWDVFGHAVWPIPLYHPDWNWPNGRHWRHEIETVMQVLRHALSTSETDIAENVRLRLEAHRSDDALLLPGRNFHLGPDARLIERFRAFMSGRIDVAGVEEGVEIRKFPYELLSKFYDRVGGRNKPFAIDHRDIVFAKSNHGQDGGQHNIPEGVELTASLLQRTLESRFRFGTPLRPDGFQHDAQLERGLRFERMLFDCVIKGATPISDDHANVFPSDVVT